MQRLRHLDAFSFMLHWLPRATSVEKEHASNASNSLLRRLDFLNYL